MNNKRKILNKVLSLALCFAIVLSTTISLGGDDGKAEAKTSLSYIESLKATSTFNILEIIPAVGQGSIGYYIAGQEPCATWPQEAASSTYDTPTKRENFVNNTRFANLRTAGILSRTADAAPLYQTGDYDEVYPWMRISNTDYSKLTLDSTYAVTGVKGTATPASNRNGEYNQNSSAVTFRAGGTGAYVQIIDHFSVTAADQSGSKYYYTPVFTPVGASLPDNTAVYTLSGTTYVYYGTTGAGFEGMELGTTYYYVTSYSAPADSSATNKYVAVSSSFQPKGTQTGYFDLTPTYTYVGTGGTYDFTYNASSATSYTINYNTVFYTGGYTNNNWFLKNVFDWDTGESKPTIKVSSVVAGASSVTTDMVRNANLIVLSYGFKPNETQTAYNGTTDISTEVSSAISTAVNAKKPVIVDTRLYGNTRNLQKLAKALGATSANSTTSFVNNSVFLFAPDASGTTPRRLALATQYFASAYDPSTYTASSGPLYPAYEVAVYENFIRDEEGLTVGHLETDVNMARAIRYIINFQGQRTENEKNSISVLFLAPTTPSTTQVNSLKTSILGWTTIPTASITVIPMSTLEFVGKSDDLVESYDLIYISDAGGTSVTKLDADYVYENIGSPVTIRTDAVGLTDSEYSTSTFNGTDGKTYNKLLNPQTTRYSGNDLSTKKLTELNDYIDSGHPVVIADGLASGGSISATVTGESTADGTGAILTANAVITGTNPATSGPYYTWYKKNTNGSYSRVGITNSTSNTYSATSGEYYCRLRYTINGSSEDTYSNSIIVTITDAETSILLSGSDTTGSATYDYNNWWYPYTTNHATYNYRFSTYISGSGLSVVTGFSADSGSGWYPTFSLQWYKDNSPVGSVKTVGYGSDTYTPPTDSGVHTYYCKITLTSISNNGTPYNLVCTPAYTQTATVTNTAASATFETGDAASSPITTSLVAGQAFFISDTLVDNCSNMYSFLNTNKSKGNFMRSGDIDTDALRRYANTSEPIISFANSSCYPTVYARSATDPYPVTSTGFLAADVGSNPATYTLKYDFTINNPTDTTPLTTTYYCNLYIDTDSDSRFIEQERIGNIEIREATSGVAGKLVDSGTLKAGQEYIVTRTLSAGMDGFLPWKLELIKASDKGVHTSVTNYTYVKPKAAEKINILQINTGSGAIGLPLDTSYPYISNTAIAATRNTILGLISKLSSDYDIKIQTCTTSEVNSIGEPTGSDVKKMTNNLVTVDGAHPTFSSTSDFIYSYDMVILGFDDCYRELDEETSAAIVDYLKHNHPILYSHDTTSMSNVPQVYDTTSQSSTNYQSSGTYWGYYFNSILRDPLGLDRYGVTNSVFGLTSKSNPLPNTKTSGLVAAAYSGLGTAVTSQETTITPAGTTITKQVLLDEGYSVAYLPGSNTSGAGGTPIGTTQGFTNYMYTGNVDSTAITQVNKGMITTYPFDVNLSSGSTMTIRPTHQQYYQANMNPDDVTVWYCLSDGGANYAYNDAMSAYYIFSNGNATYSGFGHNLDTIGTDEAKLFVNSIIAAYRITNFPPEIKFTDASGKTPLNEFLVPADLTGTLLPPTGDASASDTSRNLYFTVNDSNVAKDKTVRAIVSYGTTAATVFDYSAVKIYDSQTNTAIASGANLVSGLAYYVKIDEIIRALVAKGITMSESGTQVYVTAITHLRGADMTPVTQPITLRKLMLFDLG